MIFVLRYIQFSPYAYVDTSGILPRQSWYQAHKMIMSLLHSCERNKDMNQSCQSGKGLKFGYKNDS